MQSLVSNPLRSSTRTLVFQTLTLHSRVSVYYLQDSVHFNGNSSLSDPSVLNALCINSRRCFSGLTGCFQKSCGAGSQTATGMEFVGAGNNLFSSGNKCLVSPFIRGAATKRKEVTTRKDDGQGSALTMGEKVKQAGKDATYTGVVIIGLAVTGVMFFAIGRELLSGDSPSGIYSRAFKMCKKNEELIDRIGEPMKGYGEMTRRGRRRHTSHTEYEVDGVRIMRMKFYVEGPLGKGTAQLEVRQNEAGKYEFRYLFVTMDTYPHHTVIIQDNR